MLETLEKLLAVFVLAAGTSFASAPAAHADAGYGYYDYYDYYDVGYDEDYGDDWFYDYYDYGDAYDGYYDYNTYDYDADLFDWEEDGLFE